MMRSLVACAALSLTALPALAQPATDHAAGIATVESGADFMADFISALGESPPAGQQLAAAGFRAVRDKRQAHLDAIEATGVGLYYGDHSSFHRMTPAEKQAWIDEHKLEGTDPAMPRQSSCIDWALECVGAAYRSVGRADKFAQIKARVVAEGGRGVVLARELIADGWTGIYWNPDTRKPSDGSSEHTFSAMVARTQAKYYGLRVRGLVVDYKPSSGSTTVQKLDGLHKLAKVPFWFGMARGGSHTFVGYGTTLSEFHWTHMPNGKNAIEEKPLTEFAWLSGMIVVPPGTWPQ